MLNEIISITGSGDMLSGIGKSQSLKDGALIGMFQLPDDPDPQQKDFMSVLSGLGNGSAPMPPEAATETSLKLAQVPLSDEPATDQPVSGKAKEKSGKGGTDVRRLSFVLPEAFGAALGFLPISNPPQPDLNTDLAFDAPELEGEETPDSGLIAGESVPETVKNPCWPDPATIKAEISQILQGRDVPVLQSADPGSESMRGLAFAGTGIAQFIQGGSSQLLPGQRRTDPAFIKEGTSQVFQGGDVPVLQSADSGSESIPGLAFAGPDTAQFIQGGSSQLLSGQRRTDPAPIKEGASQVFQGGDVPALPAADLDSVTMSGPVFSRSGRAQAAHYRLIPNPQEQLQRSSFSIPEMNPINPLTGDKNPVVKGIASQRNSEDAVIGYASVGDNTPAALKGAPAERLQEVNAMPGSFRQNDDAVETDGAAAPSALTDNSGGVKTMDTFVAASFADRSDGNDDDLLIQPHEASSGDSVANLPREGQMEKTSSAHVSSNEIRPADQTFHAEVAKQVVEKAASTLRAGQSEIRIDLKPESLGHLQLHVSMEHQQVTVKILAENAQVKEMIERQAFLIKNELQHQGIKVDAVNVDMLMSGGSDFASSHHEETAFKQARNEPAYGSRQENAGQNEIKEPDSPVQTTGSGGYLVNYFA